MNVLVVYYKVAAARHAELAPRVRAFQSKLMAQHPGLACELLQRPGTADAGETWMETYRHAPALADALIDSIEQAAAAAGLPAPRHVEVFVPLN